MGVPTPFHSRTLAACKSMRWKEWAGYLCPEKYDTVHENEYHVFRQAAGLLDISPLYKYDVHGKDACRLLNRVMARDVEKLKTRQVAYSTWCDADGKVVDDGTIARLDDAHYRVTSANPSLAWFRNSARGLSVQIEDTSRDIAALALQGPKSRDVLREAGVEDIESLRFFHLQTARIGGINAIVSRTGYTGDLGYEIWVWAKDAERLWDSLMEAGRNHGIAPVGLLALDMTRIEAGFILADVDYTSARHALIEAQKSSPYEIGLGWTVHLEKEPFLGQEALLREKEEGSRHQLVGLDIDWEELERLYDDVGLPPSLPTTAWRTAVPVYQSALGRQVGRATSGTWSPLLKKNLALATVESAFSAVGTRMKIEVTVEYVRKRVTATVVKKPFFDPPRKREVTKPALKKAAAR